MSRASRAMAGAGPPEVVGERLDRVRVVAVDRRLQRAGVLHRGPDVVDGVPRDGLSRASEFPASIARCGGGRRRRFPGSRPGAPATSSARAPGASTLRRLLRPPVQPLPLHALRVRRRPRRPGELAHREGALPQRPRMRRMRGVRARPPDRTATSRTAACLGGVRQRPAPGRRPARSLSLVPRPRPAFPTVRVPLGGVWASSPAAACRSEGLAAGLARKELSGVPTTP